jgi:hypothetical protein
MLNNIKAPDLKFRYVNGLGDFIAATLHSKGLSWLTKLITGKDKPCEICSMRRHALNVLIHFPLWKLFFKTRIELLDSLAAEYRALGYDVTINYKTSKIDLSKATYEHFEPQNTLENGNTNNTNN